MSGVQTRDALVARGVDSATAGRLSRDWTLARLQLLSAADLEDLGLTSQATRAIRDGRRPPIPGPVLMKVLHGSRWICCVCRERDRPVVVHHIVPWSESRDHSFENLVLICPICHARAHRKGDLEIDLSADRLRHMRDSWYQAVEHHDATAILRLEGSSSYARWDYINHRRLFELAHACGVSLRENEWSVSLRKAGILDECGLPTDSTLWGQHPPKSHLYDFEGAAQLAAYTGSVLEEVLATLPIVDISGLWSRKALCTLVNPPQWVACSAAHYFRDETSRSEGRNQMRLGYRQAAGIRLEFPFDAWDCTSMTAWGSHIRGHRRVLSIVFVNQMAANGDLLLQGSCLAIGAYLSTLDPSPAPLGDVLLDDILAGTESDVFS